MLDNKRSKKRTILEDNKTRIEEREDKKEEKKDLTPLTDIEWS